MADYNFLNLSPYEFEMLSRDLLQKKLSITLESFTAGRDAGIDLRYANGKNKIIVQCKRYDSYNSLYSNLKKEVDKVKALSPNRYILTTSVGLTPGQKDNILILFKSYIRQSSDILGRDDLNNLLDQHPEVEKQHIKLWLSSVNIIEKILRSRIHNLATFERETIIENISLYVDNKSFNQARELIQQNNYVVISGIPGIGKTTLARMLTYHYLALGYEEFIYISESINDGYEMFHSEAKQVFFFDDFLGSNFLESKLSQNEDSRLTAFIDRIKKSENKILILTTREYILAQAREKYEKIDQSSINLAKCAIDLASYSKLAKAKILYNHIFYSKIPKEYINAILDEDSYTAIIEHPNYNPRVIKSITQKDVWQNIEPSNYLQKAINFLDYPENIWRHAFSNQISELSRNILVCMMTYGNSIDLEDLIQITKNFYRESYHIYRTNPTNREILKSIKEIEGTFISTKINRKKQTIISYQNPSVLDFLLNNTREDYDLIRQLIISAKFLNQLLFIFTIDNNNNPEEEETNKIFSGKENAAIIIDLIINTFDELPLRDSKYLFLQSLVGSPKKDSSDDEKIVYIIQNLPINKYEVIIDFIRKIYNDRLKEKFFSLDSHTKIISALKITEQKSQLITINNIKNKIISIDDLVGFNKIKDVFPESFEEYMLDNKDFLNQIHDIVNKEIDLEEEKNLENISDAIDSIEETYGMDLTKEKSYVNSRIEAYNDERIDDYLDNNSEHDYHDSDMNEDRDISDMFSSLNE